MTINEAKSILKNDAYVQAFLQFNRDPMGTYDATYQLAMDWFQATLQVSSYSSTTSTAI
jgi:hypothetical protein